MLHKIILGGERFLPYALSLLKKLKGAGLSYASRVETIDDTEIRVRVVGQHDYIYLEESPKPYEFFCSDPGASAVAGVPANGLLYTDSAPGSFSDLVMVGCGVNYKRPVFSNVLEPTQKNWRMVPVPKGPTAGGLPEQTAFKTGNDFFPSTGNLWQNQKMAEYIWRYNNLPGDFVASCLAVGLGQSFIAQQNWLGTTVIPQSQLIAEGFVAGYLAASNGGIFFSSYPRYNYTGRTSGFHELTDNWDIPPAVFTKDTSLAAGFRRGIRANWRRAAIQKHMVGGVECTYIISTDCHGGFSAYLAKDYGVDYADVPNTAVEVSIPNYPSWVSVPNLADDAKDNWVFTFNKDGTRASSTPFERVAAYVWVGSEDLGVGDTMPGYTPRSVLPGDGGPVTFYPTSGILWPLESALPGGAVIQYKVLRERVYIQTSSFGTGASATYVQGRLHGLFQGRTYASGPTTTGLEAALDVGGYEPAFLCKPGFVEVELTITPNSSDPTQFVFAATVVSEESWSANKRFYVDCGYFAPDARTLDAATAEGLANDVLLTAELEVAVRSPDQVVRSHDAVTIARTARHDKRGVVFPAFADHYNSTKADEPNCEGALVAGYHGDVEVYYVVRERNTQREVRRFCLAHNIDWFANFVKPVGSTTYLTAGPAHIASIAYADLRTLTFLTRSFTLKTGAFDTGPSASRVNAQLWELSPRYELRMLGEAVRTISYADPDLHGYTNGADPIVDAAALRPDFTKLPTPYSAPTGLASNGSGAPDSFLLAVQLWAQTSLIEACTSRSVNTHPDGHWSTYINTYGEGRSFVAADSTEPNEVFDVVKPLKSGETTHAVCFNAAFAQKRSYTDYQGVAEAGGFCTFGVWYNKNTKGY